MSDADLTGKTFGRLSVVGVDPARGNKKQARRWLVLCSCGATKSVRGDCLTADEGRDATRSCGCLGRERRLRAATKHGMRQTSTYCAWDNMLRRCANPNHPGWNDYGGRGIKVCERWFSFVNFVADMGEAPKGLELDRIDNDGSYEPGNCRWTDRTTQARNSRHALLNVEAAKVIRRMHGRVSGPLLAALHEVSVWTIYNIWYGKTWL